MYIISSESSKLSPSLSSNFIKFWLKRFKQKRRIILKNLQNIFSFVIGIIIKKKIIYVLNKNCSYSLANEN